MPQPPSSDPHPPTPNPQPRSSDPQPPTALGGLAPEAWRDQRRNFRLGVANGAIFSMTDAVYSPTVFLPWFINRLGGPYELVGLLPAIVTAGWFLPQLFVVSRVQHLPRKMPWYSWAGAARVVALAALALTTLLLAPQPGWLLLVFFLLYSLYYVAGGIGALPWLEVVGKTIPPRRRGTFFGLRAFLGGILTLLLSLVTGVLLDLGQQPGSPVAFPINFALFFLMGAVLAGVAITCWSLVREPADTRAPPRTTLRDAIRRGPQIVREDPNYRAFLTARVLLAFSAVGDPFYVVYAKERLAAPAATLSLYVGLATVAALGSNAIWSPMADRASPRTLMLTSSLSVLATPVAALLLPALVAVLIGNGAGADAWAYYSFGLVFVLSGVATGAARIINNNLLLDIAPVAERPIYIGFLNTILGLTAIVPVFGGAMVGSLGYGSVFGFAAVLAAVAIPASFGLSARRMRDA